MDFFFGAILKREKIPLNLECSPFLKLWAFSGKKSIRKSYIQPVWLYADSKFTSNMAALSSFIKNVQSLRELPELPLI